ncbi:MAG: hydrogenase maturation nickel metallochaperone HypA [Pirellulaceae bacterium]
MHEASLVKSLLRQLDQLAHAHGARRICEVNVTVGEFSGVEPDLLLAAFERETEETWLRGVRLSLKRVALEARCERCRRAFMVERFDFRCPTCRDAGATKVIRGEELMLESFTVEAEE